MVTILAGVVGSASRGALHGARNSEECGEFLCGLGFREADQGKY